MARNKRKEQQLQIRISLEQKKHLQRLAKAAGKSMSAWILDRLLPDETILFQVIMRELAADGPTHIPLAALNDLLTQLNRQEWPVVLAEPPDAKLTDLTANMVAAMVEQAAYIKGVDPPQWTANIEPLKSPWFASTLQSLRTHLLHHAPVAFRRRNLFVDATVGDRI